MEYKFGKPTQHIELDLEGEARKIADECGIDAAELLAEAERIAASAN